tara:strand:- start:87835 stop:88644 length:810 start_codon:yes stop_codon:yes gene_type:complete
MIVGTLKKLKTNHSKDNTVQYTLPLGGESATEVELNSLIGKSITLKHTGNKFCIETGKKVKQLYHQGYSWESFITLPECDKCIFQPELCHFSHGTCRDEKWGEDNCFQPHIVYIAQSSDVKVGITRKKNVPHRWMDQGAFKAIPILEVKDRKTSGLIEIEIAKELGDKTNWRKMLKNDLEDVDLLKVREKVLKKFSKVIEQNQANVLDVKEYEFSYPVEKYPSKVSSLNFEKTPEITGKLVGIKGQYFIFEHGVINIRRHQGYEIEFTY